MDIRKIAFTGSTMTGKAIKKAAAESNLKVVTLELGGKSPMVVFDDADLEKAAADAAFSILAVSGQICMASSRVYVDERVATKFVELVSKDALTAVEALLVLIKFAPTGKGRNYQSGPQRRPLGTRDISRTTGGPAAV